MYDNRVALPAQFVHKRILNLLYGNPAKRPKNTVLWGNFISLPYFEFTQTVFKSK